MSTYSVVYLGPSVEEDEVNAERIRGAIVTKYPFSEKEVHRRLQQVPFALVSGLPKIEAERHALFLRAMNAKVDLRADPEPEGSDDTWEGLHAPEFNKRIVGKGSGRATLYNLAPGLLIISVIFLAGIAQITGAHFWINNTEPFWPLSASGWGTIGMSIFILAGFIVLRLPIIMKTIGAPDMSTPLKCLESYYGAINARHWEKAVLCLGYRPGSHDLGAQEKTELIEYFKSLASEQVLPDEVDPVGASIRKYSKDFLELRFIVKTVSRKPMSDGTRLQRAMVDICRFKKVNGKWFLIDGRVFGQKSPERLPLSACRYCGEETLMGQPACSSCQKVVPPYALESETWLAPKRKPDIAALLSAVIPGLGQTYNGQPVKGAIIAATCWMILPWAAGVIDAIYVAERINRKGSLHDLQSRPWVPMTLHFLLFASAILTVLFNAENLPLLRDIIDASRPEQEEISQTSVVARFRGKDGNFSILFPYQWEVDEIPDPDNTELEGGVSVKGVSRDGQSTILISTRMRPSMWSPCPHAMETRRKLEDEGNQIAHFECGSKGGREQYRLDSYTSDRRWRRSLLVLSFEDELVVLAFVCPVESQNTMVSVFERVSESIRYVQVSDTSINR